MSRQKRTSGVECRDCGEFSMEKSFKGSSLAVNESGFTDITLPESCPVCGADLDEQESASEL